MKINQAILMWKVSFAVARWTTFSTWMKVKHWIKGDETVTCDLCKLPYRAIDVDTNQGDECATFLYANKVVGAYGSTQHDGDVFEWCEPSSFETFASKGEHELVACDDCINELSHEGIIQLVRSEQYWGLER